jgi:hypothetical protein
MNETNNKENIRISNSKIKTSIVDDILTDCCRAQLPRKAPLRNNNTTSLLPTLKEFEVSRQSDDAPDQPSTNLNGPYRKVCIQGVSVDRAESLIRMPQRDVVEATIQYGSMLSTHRTMNSMLVAATTVFVHPHRPVASGQQDRLHDWCEALCSVYDACRTVSIDGTCAGHEYMFYLVNSNMTAIFYRQQEDGIMVAVLLKCTPGLERLLESMGVQYEQGDKGLLVFKGSHRVHGLFDTILNTIHQDMPKIYAPTPFRNATMIRYPLVVKPQAQTVTIEDACIPAWVVSRIRDAVSTQESTGIRITLHT